MRNKKQIQPQKQMGKRTKKKIFLTEFKTSDGLFAWHIKAADWQEAEYICKAINHRLKGEVG